MDAPHRAAKYDPEMIAAVDKARATFPDFLTEADADLRRLIPVLEDALLKVYIARTDAPEVGEHLWVRYIGSDPEREGRFRGVMLSSPVHVADVVAEGDTVNLSIKSLSDWLYVTGGKAFGAYTVKVLRSRMSDAERKEHDAAYPFSFD